MYNPVSRSYGEPHKRPEVQNATIEFIAPSEYMVSLTPRAQLSKKPRLQTLYIGMLCCF